MEDFDFDYCKYYKLEFIIYIQVWNTKLKIFIWIYVWFIEKKIYYLDEIKNQAKSKISLIIDGHRITSNRYENSFFQEKDDIRIFLSKFEKIEKHGWFLE